MSLDSTVEDLVRQYGYPALAGVILVENLFPPIPSEVVLPLAGYQVSRGVLGFGWSVVFAVRDRRTEFLTPIRLSLARYLTLGLEFQLAGDILRTAIAPTFQEIGQLAAIAAIRTALNYFVGREIRQERAEIEAQAAAEKQTQT